MVIIDQSEAFIETSDQSEASTDLVEAESLLEVAVKAASDEIPRGWTEAEIVIPETSANEKGVLL